MDDPVSVFVSHLAFVQSIASESTPCEFCNEPQTLTIEWPVIKELAGGGTTVFEYKAYQCCKTCFAILLGKSEMGSENG